MNLINKIKLLIKKFFDKNKIKEIEAPQKKEMKEEKEKYINSLKVFPSIIDLDKKSIETLICEGDGLGIDIKIDY